MKPFFRLLPILFALLLAPLCHARGAGEGTPTIPPESKLRAALQMIEALYVDSVDSSHLAEEAIIAMLRELDPHSLYSDPKETRALSEPLAGNFSGIGIRFQMLRDTVYVIETTPGGPSEKIGIVAGDRIISCNDTLVSGRKLKNTDILPILRGPKGSTAILKVKRARQTEPIIFKATRDDIPINSVDFAYMVNDSTGIISLARFAETSTDEFTDALKKLRRQGLKHLIIDLKDNGGGLLRQATDIANIFLHRGDTIVSTRSSKMEPAVYRAIHEGKFTDGRLVVIVNTYSASASEILAGAISDNDRGVIVGSRTFGKGLVQRPLHFPDGSMIRLTVARYYTPSGRCIQKPYTAGDTDAYADDLRHRFTSGELTSADSIHLADSTVYRTLRLGRPVYGGGGIIPDAFVPIDTTLITPLYRSLMAKGVISNFATGYIDRHRGKLRSLYPSEEEYVATADPASDPAMMDAFKAAAADEQIVIDEEEFAISEPLIKTILKALIGREIFGTETYYKIVNPLTPAFLKAVEIINSPQTYNSYLSRPTNPE